MATLDNNDRLRVWRALMRYWSDELETIAVSKPELKAAVDATDDWIDDNQASFNSALPLPARTALTSNQKTLMFCAVALMRVDPGLAKLLRNALGVDTE